MILGDDHNPSAIVLLQSVSESRLRRDELCELYHNCNRDTGCTCQLLHKPQSDVDPAMLFIDGSDTYGHRLGEAGLQRHRSASLNNTD